MTKIRNEYAHSSSTEDLIIEGEAVVDLSLENDVSATKQIDAQHDFVVAQYNILAEYLGDNRLPWFLYGTKVSEERRNEIFAKFYQQNEHGELVNRGWPNFVEGILSKDEMARVEEINDKWFSWETRKIKLLQTIKGLNADLISLVECDNYEEFFRPEMEKLGYGALYKKRPRCTSCDGCAIFYRRSVFELEASHAMDFEDLVGDHTVEPSKDRVGLFSLLRHASGRRIIFISTHLARNPEDPEKRRYRARQVGQLLYRLTTFSREHNAMDVPTILAGDMNSNNIRQIANIARVFFRLALEPAHPFVYAAKAPDSKPTSVTSMRKVRIDYLPLQTGLLEVVQAFEIDELSMDDPIPNQSHPSDHLPLVFRVGFKEHSTMLQNYTWVWANTILGDIIRSDTILGCGELRLAFDFLDLHLTGVCSTADFSSGLCKLGLKGKIPDVLRVLEKHLGRSLAKVPLRFDEFVSVYMKSLLIMKEYLLRDLCPVYSFFDTDASGFLDFDELYESFVRTCPFEVSRDAFKAVFDRLDANGDGIVTIEEFFECLLKSHLRHEKCEP